MKEGFKKIGKWYRQIVRLANPAYKTKMLKLAEEVQQLKENLNNQFGTIRDAIYEKAFSHFKR